jgi:hypothetical protein
MRYLNDDAMHMSGPSNSGQVFEGIDGYLYEWVEGLNDTGEAIGFWRGISDEPSGVSGLGALYAAPDGSLYELHGFAEEEAAAPESPAAAEGGDEAGQGDKPATSPMGAGKPGEIRTGPDGKKYRWVIGHDAQGKRTGSWRRVRPVGRLMRRLAQRPGQRAAMRSPSRGRPGTARPGGRKPLLKRLLPFAKFATALIPGVGPAVATGLTVAGKLLKKKQGVQGYHGLGMLYEASDGSVYQVRGLADEELNGFAADELNGFGADELDGFGADELDGFGADELEGFHDAEVLQGVDAGDELDGLSQHEQLQSFADEQPPLGAEELQGLEQAYIREDSVNGLEAYVPERPPATRWFVSPDDTPDIWKPLW